MLLNSISHLTNQKYSNFDIKIIENFSEFYSTLRVTVTNWSLLQGIASLQTTLPLPVCHCQLLSTKEPCPRIPLFVSDQLSCPSLMHKCKWLLLSGGLGKRWIRNIYNISSPNRTLGEGYVQLLIGEQWMGSTMLNLGN